MGKMQRNKGARGEREVVAIARDHGFPHARRYGSGDGLQPGDIDGGPDEWIVEVKWWGDVTAAMREGLAQAHDERVTTGRRWATVAVRLPGGSTRWVAVMHADTWLRCPEFGDLAARHHEGTVPARLALTLNTGALCDIGRGRVALPLTAWFDALTPNTKDNAA